MKPVVPVAFAANKREGNFRFAHARLREFSESVVFYNGQASEQARVNALFDDLYTTLRQKIRVSFPTYFFSMFSQCLIGPILYGIMTIYYVFLNGFRGDTAGASFALFLAAQGYLNYVASVYATLTLYISQVSDVAAVAHRVSYVTDTLKSISSTYAYFEDR
jgi:ABC-type uncharacterized transport system fused permease/ATPase subunit